MAYQVLGRKWRPQRFDEVVGQDHIVRSLLGSLRSGKIAQAYLLSGTRGTGKTSVARIFAKSLCCDQRQEDGNPCGQCVSCLGIQDGSSFDVLEIDGASHNSVDDVRQLIENVQYLPTHGQYKVYIVDEVHMLSASAFNAFLKTLEEPPAHVVFIFATTNPEKLLQTILSRCQRFDFKHVSLPVLLEQVKKILKSEEIDYESENELISICRLGAGSVRDTLSLLDQVITYTQGQKITSEATVTALGIASTELLKILVSSLLKGDLKTLVHHFRKALEQNIEVDHLAQGLLDHVYSVLDQIDFEEKIYRGSLLSQDALKGISYAELYWIYETMAKDFEWTLKGLDPIRHTELVLHKLCLRREFLKSVSESVSVSESETESEESVEQTSEPEVTSPPNPDSDSDSDSGPTQNLSWLSFLDSLRQQSPALAANLEQGNCLSEPKKEAGAVRVSLAFGHGSKVFFDYLVDKEVRERAQKALAEYYGVADENIELKIELLDDKKRHESGFKSQAEIYEEERIKIQQERKEKILTHPQIVFAKEIFKTNIDRINLNESN